MSNGSKQLKHLFDIQILGIYILKQWGLSPQRICLSWRLPPLCRGTCLQYTMCILYNARIVSFAPTCNTPINTKCITSLQTVVLSTLLFKSFQNMMTLSYTRYILYCLRVYQQVLRKIITKSKSKSHISNSNYTAIARASNEIVHYGT